MNSEPCISPELSPLSLFFLPFAGWSTVDLSKRREAVKVREEDSHKPRMRDGQ